MEERNNVNHPSHYNRENAMECIDEMELIFGKEAVKNFCLCNAWKYRYRASDKNGEEDIKKSDWYLNKYKEYLDKEDACQTNISFPIQPISTGNEKWWNWNGPYYSITPNTVDVPPTQIYCTGKTN